MCAVTTAGHHLPTCWAEPEPSISQYHEQKSGAEKLGKAQREVSELGVRVIPAVTRNAAEAPQQGGVHPGPDEGTRIRRTELRCSKVPGTEAHLQLTMVYKRSHLLVAYKRPFLRATARLRYFR